MAALQKSGGAIRALRGIREERCSLRPPASGKKRLLHRASREEEGGGEDEEGDIDAELESMLGNADEQDASSSFSISADADAEADEDDLLNEPFDSSAIASNDDHLRHPNGADGSSSSNNADSAETEGELKEMTVPHFRSSMMLSALLDIAGNEIREYRRTGSPPELIEITGLTHDVRALAPCDVFVCVPGHIFDGHKYAESAARLGASAIVAERELRKVEKKFALPVIYVENARWALVVLADAFYGMPSRTLNACVGITGTNGKTTTAYLIKAMLEEANHDVGMASTIAQEVGDTKLSPCGEIWQPDEEDPEPDRQVTSPGALAPYYGRYPGPPATTPDALNIQQLINGMTEEGADAAVIECTSHALHQGRVSRVHFDTVVSTNLTHDYLDGHGSFWEYKRANMRLFSQLVEEQEIDDIMVNDDDLASTIEHRKKGNENLNALDVEDEQPLNGEETRTADEDEEDDPYLELTDEVLGSDEEDDEESEDLEAERAALADMEEDFGEPRSEGSIDGFSEEGIPSARSESLQSGNAARSGKGRNGEIEATEEEEEESDPDVQNMELPDLPPRRAVINADDPDYVDFVDVTYPLECVKYSRDPERTDVDVVADTVQFSLFETELDIRTPNGKVNVLTPLIGEPNVMNVLAAVATGVARDVPLDTIKAGIESVVSVPGRLELIDLGQPYAVVVDYAHTPDALDRLLQTVHEVGAKRIITVFGCGGDRDQEKRPVMGKIAHDRSDIVFVTSDNPRTESPSGICDDVVSGFEDELYSQPKLAALNLAFLKDMNRFNEFWHRDILELQEYTKRYVIEDRYTAIRAAINMASEQDAVVIAGKGHEDFIEVGNNYYWFDDRAEARHTLETQRQMYERQNGEPVTDFSRLPWRQYPQSNRVSLLDLVKDVSKSEHSSAAR